MEADTNANTDSDYTDCDTTYLGIRKKDVPTVIDSVVQGHFLREKTVFLTIFAMETRGERYLNGPTQTAPPSALAGFFQRVKLWFI